MDARVIPRARSDSRETHGGTPPPITKRANRGSPLTYLSGIHVHTRAHTRFRASINGKRTFPENGRVSFSLPPPPPPPHLPLLSAKTHVLSEDEKSKRESLRRFARLAARYLARFSNEIFDIPRRDNRGACRQGSARRAPRTHARRSHCPMVRGLPGN